MRDIIEFSVVESTPDLDAILHREVGGRRPQARITRLFRDALGLFERLAAPRGMLAEVSESAFADIYAGEGLNAPATPIAEIYSRAQRLALFAATIGDAVSEEIGAQFGRGDPAVGYALDVLASEGTSILADSLARRFREALRARGPADLCVLPYSPGYCGWHVSGQRRLFQALQPAAIGLGLSGSFLMRPLKSVSGVLVAGPPAVHRFKPIYPFCNDCTTHECRARMIASRRAPR
ncbi:MAG TPA: hypothetical protein VK886_06150 [Vicinamibacterales bacterium]|nr:hypothetical protein [Vicinamibacterales bacterium]